MILCPVFREGVDLFTNFQIEGMPIIGWLDPAPMGLSFAMEGDNKTAAE